MFENHHKMSNVDIFGALIRIFSLFDYFDSFVWKWDILGDFSNIVEEVMDIFDN